MTDRSVKLDTVHRSISFTPHIVLREEVCSACETKPCLLFCPAGCFETGDEGELVFHYEGCHECGTCRMMCTQGIESWEWPQGGSGVIFRMG